MSQSSVFYFKGSEKLQEISFRELQRGLHYGDGFWDSFLICHKRIHNRIEHLKRYTASSEFLNLNSLAFTALEKIIEESVKVGYYRGRISVVRAPGGRYKSETKDCYTILEISEAEAFTISSKPIVEVLEFDYSLRCPGSEFKLLGTAGKTWLADKNHNPEVKTLAFSGMDGLVCAESGNLGLMTERNHFIFPSLDSGAISGCTLNCFTGFLKQNGYSYDFRKVNNIRELSHDIAFSINSMGVTLFDELVHGPLLFKAGDEGKASLKELMLDFKSYVDSN